MMNFTNPNRKPQRLDTDNKVIYTGITLWSKVF